LPSHRMAVGVFEQHGPAGAAGGGDGHPFPEPATGGSKWKAASGVDERFYVAGVEFDDQLLGVGVPRGEEVPVQAQTGKAQHGGAGHARYG